MIITNIILGLIGIAIGYAMLRYAFLIVENVGSVGWVEDHIGAGQTANSFRLLGVIFVVGSLLMMFGLLGPALGWILHTVGKPLGF